MILKRRKQTNSEDIENAIGGLEGGVAAWGAWRELNGCELKWAELYCARKINRASRVCKQAPSTAAGNNKMIQKQGHGCASREPKRAELCEERGEERRGEPCTAPERR